MLNYKITNNKVYKFIFTLFINKYDEIRNKYTMTYYKKIIYL